MEVCVVILIFLQKFLSLKSTKTMFIFCNFFNFQGYPRPVEIPGRQNWANMGNLAQFAQNERKNNKGSCNFS